MKVQYLPQKVSCNKVQGFTGKEVEGSGIVASSYMYNVIIDNIDVILSLLSLSVYLATQYTFTITQQNSSLYIFISSLCKLLLDSELNILNE